MCRSASRRLHAAASRRRMATTSRYLFGAERGSSGVGHRLGQPIRHTIGAAMAETRTLRGISEIRGFFRTNETPDLFHLAHRVQSARDRPLGARLLLRQLLRLVRGQPSARVGPRGAPYPEFESSEDICNYLLAHREVLELVRSRAARREGGVRVLRRGDRGLCGRRPGWRWPCPPAELRHRLDSKIVTTQLGDEAGVPSVPNVLGRAESYEELLELAADAGLGDDLVVQTPYGDSGKTTFFVDPRGRLGRERRGDVAPGAQGHAAHQPARAWRWRPASRATAPSSGR